MAAGFGLATSGIPAFHAFLDERLAAAGDLPQAADLRVEGALAVPGCTVELAQHIGRLAPFGPGNDEPLVVVSRVRVGHAERIGAEGKTLRVMLEGEEGGPRLKSVMFRAGEGAAVAALLARDGVPLHVAGHLRADAWNGRVTPGFTIVDVAPVAAQ